MKNNEPDGNCWEYYLGILTDLNLYQDGYIIDSVQDETIYLPDDNECVYPDMKKTRKEIEYHGKTLFNKPIPGTTGVLTYFAEDINGFLNKIREVGMFNEKFELRGNAYI